MIQGRLSGFVKKVKENIGGIKQQVVSNYKTKKLNQIADEMKKHNNAVARETKNPTQYSAYQKQLSNNQVKKLGEKANKYK